MTKKEEIKSQKESVQHHSKVPLQITAGLETEVLELKKKLKEKEKEVEIYKDRALRTIAELANFRRKTEENMREFTKYSNAEFIDKFLPILDSFASAFGPAMLDKNTEDKKFYSGIELIYKDILNLLEKEGLKQQDVLGKEFDPLLHEVVGIVEVEDKDAEVPPSGTAAKPWDENVILEEVRKGYTFHDKVIRHALVKISKKKQAITGENING